MTTEPAAPQFSTAEFEPELLDGHGHFVRGLLFGAGGALIGLALYATVVIVTNYEIGFVSLAVGWIVGKAVLAGSRGRAGRRYQVAAALLTYFAVSVAVVPVALYQFAKNPTGVESTADPAAKEAPGATSPGSDALPADAADEASPGFVRVFGGLLVLGLIAPFLGLQDMPGGLISLVILAVGVHIAWKMTGRPELIVAEAMAGPPADDKPTALDLNR